MKLALKLAAIAIVAIAAAWLVFSWFEADTEIRVLCSMFHPGLEREHVVHTLDTGEHLWYRTDADSVDAPILVDSLFNLRLSRCVVEFEAGRVVSSTYTGRAKAEP
jgi:hypothetical protein